MFFAIFYTFAAFSSAVAVVKITTQMSNENPTPLVSIIMGSTSDFDVMRRAADHLDELSIPFEINALSAHRTPDLVAKFAQEAQGRGVRVIIAGAGGAAHLPGVIASFTSLPVIGVPIRSSNSIEGLDSILSILQMPSGIPVATVALDGAANAAILASQILALTDVAIQQRVQAHKHALRSKVIKANEELATHSFTHKVD